MNDLQNSFNKYAVTEQNFLNDRITQIKNILQYTDFLKGSLLAYDESVLEESEQKTDVSRFMTYKQDYFPYTGLDCDATIWVNVMYALLYGFETEISENKCQIIPQTKYSCKYEIKLPNKHYYRGDTLTSGWTVLKNYLHMLWCKDSASEQFKALFKENKVTGEIELPENEKEWKFEKYVWKNADIISKEMSAESKAFYQNIFNCGNYICIPAGSWKESFNMRCSNYGLWDTVDRMLWKIYQYFVNGDEQYLKEMFTDGKDAVCAKVLQWFEDFSVQTWDNFVEVHCFQDYVRENADDVMRKYGSPVSLKWSRAKEDFCKIIYIDDILDVNADYEPLPAGGEFENFFSSANYFLQKRTERIYNKIKA